MPSPEPKPGQAIPTAPSSLDEALATCERTGHRSFEAELHRVRGETLLKGDPGNPAPAEKPFSPLRHRETARRSELNCVRRFRSPNSTNRSRPADAHAVLAPALEGFSPRPEMPEIAEAQALLVAIEAGAHLRHE